MISFAVRKVNGIACFSEIPPLGDGCGISDYTPLPFRNGIKYGIIYANEKMELRRSIEEWA
jgi:hypothetical protein